MANRFWVGGTGTWDQASTAHWSASSGGGSGAAVPVAGDDVFFDANSGVGTVTLSANAPCRSLNSSGSTVTTLSHAASVTLTIGDATAGVGSVALDLSGFTTYTLGSVTTSALSFVSTSATTQTIKTGGSSVGNVTFNGTGASWQLVDGLNNGSTALVTLTAGTFSTNAQTCSWGGLFIAGSTTRTLTITNSSITITSNNGTFTNNVDFSTITNLTLNTTGSTVTLTGASPRFVGNGATTPVWGNVVCNTAGSATFGYFSCSNLTRNGTASKFDAVTFTEVVVSGVLTLSGNSVTNRLLSQTGHAFGSQYTITVNGSYSLTNVDFADAKAAGTAGTWTGTSLGDAGNNTNITFDTPVTQTHVAGAGGNWSTAANWTSRVPLPQDNVLINGNTTGTITPDMPRLGKSVDFTGFVGTASFSSNGNTMYGSLTLSSGMTVSGGQTLTFAGRSSQTITSNGKTFTTPLTITGAGGTFTLQDDFNSSNGLSVNVGTFDANNKNLTMAFFASSSINTSIRVIKMGSGTWTVNGTGTVWNISNFPSGATNFLAQGSTVVFSNVSSTAKTIIPGGSAVIYNNISITGGGTGQIIWDNSTVQFLGGCTSLTIGAPKSVAFTAGFTYKTNNFVATGSSGNVITLQSRTPGSQFTLIQPSGVVSCDWLSIQDSAATGGAGWYAGANSTNVSDNTGWVFTVPPTPGPRLGTLGVG